MTNYKSAKNKYNYYKICKPIYLYHQIYYFRQTLISIIIPYQNIYYYQIFIYKVISLTKTTTNVSRWTKNASIL